MTPFSFSAGDTSVDVGSVSNDDVVYLATVTKSVAGNRVFTLGDGSNTATVSVANPSVVAVNVASLPNTATVSLSAASLTGDQTLEGVLVVGRVHALPDGRES